MGMRRSWQRRRLSHAKESTSAPIRQRRVLSLLLALVLLPLGQAFQPHLHPPHPRWRVGVGRERGGGRIGVDEWRMVGGGGVGPLAAKPPRRRQQQAEAGELQHEEQQPIQESPSGKPPLSGASPPPPAAAEGARPKYPPGFKPFRQPSSSKYNNRRDGGSDGGGAAPGPVRWLRLTEGSAMTEEVFQEAVTALRALIGEGQAAKALAALESLQAQAIPPATIYDEVFGCCAASGEWEAHAQRVLGHAATVAGEGGPRLATFQAALDAIYQGMRKREGGEKGEWAERAVRVYEAMVEAGVTPDGRAVEGVLSALAQAGRQEEALALIHQATSTLHVPSTKYWYRIVLGSFFRRATSGGGGGGGNGGSGRKAYSSSYPGPDYKTIQRLLLASSPVIDEPAVVFLLEEAFRTPHKRLQYYTVRPLLRLALDHLGDEGWEEGTYLLMLNLCKTVGALEEALATLKAMSHSPQGGGANVLAFNMALKACEKAGDAGRALRLLEDMEGVGLQPDLITINTAISACAKGERAKDAKRLIREMEERWGLMPSLVTYNSLIDALAHTGRWKEAIEVLSALQRRGLTPDVITYTGLIQACSKGRQAQKALSFLDAMKLAGVRPDAVAYSAAIEACARGQGLAARALQLYEELLNAGFEPQPQVYRALVTACGEASRSEGGGTKRVWEILQLCPPQRRNNFVYSAAIKACEREKDWKTALRLLDDMRALRIEEPDDVTYGQLLHVLSSSGRWAEALAVLQPIRRRNLRHYTSAIRACAQPECPDFKGLETFRQMRAEGIKPDLHAYNVVLQSLRPAGDARAAAEALALYAEMTAESGVGRVVPDIVTLTHVISLLERHGRHADALRLFSEGCRRRLLLQASLDSLWERDLSRLSYQLVRAAVDHALGEIAADYAAQRAESKEPNVHDLVLITGVDSSAPAARVARGVGGGRGGLSPETRQGLAHAVLLWKGGGGYFMPEVAGGELRVRREQLRRWLQDGAPPP